MRKRREVFEKKERAKEKGKRKKEDEGQKSKGEAGSKKQEEKSRVKSEILPQSGILLLKRKGGQGRLIFGLLEIVLTLVFTFSNLHIFQFFNLPNPVFARSALGRLRLLPLSSRL